VLIRTGGGEIMVISQPVLNEATINNIAEATKKDFLTLYNQEQALNRALGETYLRSTLNDSFSTNQNDLEILGNVRKTHKYIEIPSEGITFNQLLHLPSVSRRDPERTE
jgi:hypothetical protein